MRRTIPLLGVALLVSSLLVLELVSSGGRKGGGANLVPTAQAQGRRFEPAQAKGCSNRTLKGTFGVTFSGTAAVGGFEGKSGAVVGLFSFDGNGYVTATVTANANGTVLRRQAAGTYAVNPDCTGSIAIAAVPVSLLTFGADGVVVNDGTEILFIGTIPELVFSGVAKKL